MTEKTVYVLSHPNLALVKYWGVMPKEIIGDLGIPRYPTKSSASLIADSYKTVTELTIIPNGSGKLLEFYLDREKISQDSKEWSNVEEFIRNLAIVSGLSSLYKYNYKIRSANDFPTGAGLASSASGFSALAYAFYKVIPEFQNLDERTLSIYAAQLSGSASRSIPSSGGFVVWYRGFDMYQLRNYSQLGFDRDVILKSSYAESLIPAEELDDLRIIIVTVNSAKKNISSREGMEITTRTDPLYWDWVKYEEYILLPHLISAMRSKDYPRVWELTMKASDGLHSSMLRSYPRIVYMNDASHRVAELIIELNQNHGRNIAAYSFDAGPNPIIFTTQEYVQKIVNVLRDNGYDRISVSKVGKGTRQVDEEEGRRLLEHIENMKRSD
ncbi:MAG: diphosphomevalonate decarboxylase [Candidatus Anstonellales archaeon]